MKTLIKRPNYTLSIKTSCYSAFSFYTFFRTDRIPALPTATLINLLSFPTEAFLFCLVDRRTNSFTDHTYSRLIYRRERTSPLLYI